MLIDIVSRQIVPSIIYIFYHQNILDILFSEPTCFNTLFNTKQEVVNLPNLEVFFENVKMVSPAKVQLIIAWMKHQLKWILEWSKPYVK